MIALPLVSFASSSSPTLLLGTSFSATTLLNTTFAASVVSLFGAATASASIGGAIVNNASIAFVYPRVAALGVILKTHVVYQHDAVVAVKYTVSDAAGRLHCSPTGAAVSLTVGSTAASCTMFSASSASGVCTLTLPAALFGASSSLAANVTLSYDG